MTDATFIVELTEENFQELIGTASRERPVLVDFWASWCQPCRILMPLLSRLAEEYGGKFILAKLNTEEQQGIASRFGIRSIPTVKLFRDGQPVDEFMGALPEAEIRSFLDRHIPRESDGLVAHADDLIQSGDSDGAAKLLREAQSMDPDNPRVRLAALRLQAALGEFDEAEAALDGLPATMRDDPEVAALTARVMFGRAAAASAPVVQLEAALAAGDEESATLFGLAAHRVGENKLEEALELLLDLMKRDRGYDNQAARRGILAIFDILGNSGELVSRYRGRMFNLLY